MNRRYFMLGVLAAPLLTTHARAAGPRLEVFKSPTCGCCSAWVSHVTDAGFQVDARDVSQSVLQGLKAQLGITAALSSCHTALIEGYFIEGHVPAADIERLLGQRPDALGLSVPDMPIGSPGMEVGDEKEPFDTLLVLADGTTRVFASHG